MDVDRQRDRTRRHGPCSPSFSGVAPITLDEVLIGKIVAFIEAARALLIVEPPDERNQLRRDLLEAAIGMRKVWADEIATIPAIPRIRSW